VDLGLTACVPLLWQPAPTVGIAFGSGDTGPSGRVVRSVRQTGLHNTEGTFTEGARSRSSRSGVLSLGNFTFVCAVRPRVADGRLRQRGYRLRGGS
jgi:hypothetical protein